MAAPRALTLGRTRRPGAANTHSSILHGSVATPPSSNTVSVRPKMRRAGATGATGRGRKR
eukprot:5860849-Prymnesium_polylepis.1